MNRSKSTKSKTPTRGINNNDGTTAGREKAIAKLGAGK